MNHEALLALLATLYAQLMAATDQLERLRAELAQLRQADEYGRPVTMADEVPANG